MRIGRLVIIIRWERDSYECSCCQRLSYTRVDMRPAITTYMQQRPQRELVCITCLPLDCWRDFGWTLTDWKEWEAAS